MMIFRKTVPRRAVLRGLGATVALPMLDAMVPAFAGTLDGDPRAIRRLSAVYVPTGMIMDKWTPPAASAGLGISPILEPLAPFRERLTVLSGLALRNADALLPGEGAVGNHSRASATFLSGAHPRKTEGADLEAGVTLDQIAARHLCRDTPLSSLELCMEDELVGVCEQGYSCAYLNTISWRNATTPMPMETQPRLVFERLFGDGSSTDPTERARRLAQNRSILDSVAAEATGLIGRLGATDRLKMHQFLESVRDVELRIQNAGTRTARDTPAGMRMERPVGIPDTFEAYAKLMFDLQVLAYQGDLTRVISLMVAREQSARAYPEIGVGDPHHPLTHHSGDPDKIAKVIKINVLHARLFAYFLDRLATTPDGDGSLLDRMLILYGSAISDGNLHLHDDLPVMIVAGRETPVRGNRHLQYAKGTPLPNLYLTLLDRIGAPMEQLGDSTGRLELLTV